MGANCRISGEINVMAFEPFPGSPIVTLPDGRKLAVTIFPDTGLGLTGCGVMLYAERMGVWNWTAEQWFAKWQAVMPTPGIPDDQTLSWIVAQAGGPAPFIVDLMAFSSKAMMQMLGFTPGRTPSQSEWALTEALKDWEILSLIAGQFVLPRPKG